MLKTKPSIACIKPVCPATLFIGSFIILTFRETKKRFLMRRARLDGQAAQNPAPPPMPPRRGTISPPTHKYRKASTRPPCFPPSPSYHAALTQRFDATSKHSFTQPSDCPSLSHFFHTHNISISASCLVRVHCSPQSSFVSTCNY